MTKVFLLRVCRTPLQDTSGGRGSQGGVKIHKRGTDSVEMDSALCFQRKVDL